ncbi:MAG: winged helix-turn-helix transcriptional regulator [Tissierellia bacterium]|nr:winged helix-turn-helix transcriptional regulator [Tissierellia bacterium]
MTNREKEILELINKNPMASQSELADILGISRSSVAVHITNLLKKGNILGKGYILSDSEFVTVVGGANMDIQGFTFEKIIYNDSNIGSVKLSLGGVGRNIGENLIKLGVNTKLISVIGDDIYGSKILEEANLIGLDMEHSLKLEGQPTSTYLAVLDENHEMAVAVSSMEIYDRMTIDFIKEKRHIIEGAKACVLDTNIPIEVMEHMLTTHKNTDFFLDTVSTAKAKKVKSLIGYFHTIKPNKIETETLTGIKIKNEDDLKKAAEYFLNLGVKNIFITLGEDGVFYSDGTNMKHLKTKPIKPVNVTGAGDAFSAALVYGYINELGIHETAKIAVAASIIGLSHENTINPNMSIENIYSKIKEIKL